MSSGCRWLRRYTPEDTSHSGNRDVHVSLDSTCTCSSLVIPDVKGKETKMMTIATVLDLVNVFFAGMLAGIEFVIHYGVREPAETLDDQSQLQLRQALVKKLRAIVPAFFATMAVLGIALTFLNT